MASQSRPKKSPKARPVKKPSRPAERVKTFLQTRVSPLEPKKSLAKTIRAKRAPAVFKPRRHNNLQKHLATSSRTLKLMRLRPEAKKQPVPLLTILALILAVSCVSFAAATYFLPNWTTRTFAVSKQDQTRRPLKLQRPQIRDHQTSSQL